MALARPLNISHEPEHLARAKNYAFFYSDSMYSFILSYITFNIHFFYWPESLLALAWDWSERHGHTSCEWLCAVSDHSLYLAKMFWVLANVVFVYWSAIYSRHHELFHDVASSQHGRALSRRLDALRRIAQSLFLLRKVDSYRLSIRVDFSIRVCLFEC
jgi:hypothetical protein